MEKNLNDREALKKLKQLTEDVRVCMMADADTTSDKYGRPMSTIQADDDGTLWFFTKDNQPVAQNAANGNTATLYYAHPGKNIYLTVQGSAHLVKDKNKMEELYNPMLKAWFPEGLDEPGIALLKVTPRQARYWDADAAKLVILFSMVQAAVTGQTTDMGNHGELHINK